MYVHPTLKAILIWNCIFVICTCTHTHRHTLKDTHTLTFALYFIVLQNFDTTVNTALVLALALASTVFLETQTTALVEGVKYFVYILCLISTGGANEGAGQC